MTPVLQWIKSHVVVVICSVLIIAAPVASYIVAGGMVESARSDLQGRASGLRDLKSNRTTTVSLEVPGSAVASISAAPNQRLVDAYREAVEKISGQADLIRAAGLAHNRNINGRTRSGDELMPGHFPVPPGGRTGFEEMPARLHVALVDAYEGLLDSVGAGMPPSSADVAGRLDRRRVNFVAGQRKDSVSELDDDELEGLRSELTDARLTIYREAATGEDGSDPIRFYADESVLGVPPVPSGSLPMATMFDWQWRFWVTEDLLFAFADANGDEDVLTGPMKRVLSFSIAPVGAGGEDANGGGGGGRGGGGMGTPGMGNAGMGGAGRNMGGGGGAAAAPGIVGAPADPGVAQVDSSLEARRDPSVSITGRVSNDVYDIRTVQCSIVVSTRGLPKVLDAIARRNFMTVLDLKLRPADSFEAAREGFIYGVEPVSVVDLTIETVWFREWTAESMPKDMREMLGIRSTPAQGTAG